MSRSNGRSRHKLGGGSKRVSSRETIYHVWRRRGRGPCAGGTDACKCGLMSLVARRWTSFVPSTRLSCRPRRMRSCGRGGVGSRFSISALPLVFYVRTANQNPSKQTNFQTHIFKLSCPACCIAQFRGRTRLHATPRARSACPREIPVTSALCCGLSCLARPLLAFPTPLASAFSAASITTFGMFQRTHCVDGAYFI
jgi:hypothetical protein